MPLLRRFVPLLSLLVVCAAQAEPSVDDTLPMNHLQVIGSHNSYKQAIDRPLLKLLATFSDQAERLDYHHASLTDQLNLGLRGLELDVFNDPAGGHYAEPLGIDMLTKGGQAPRPYDPDGVMSKPGFKVLHVQDIDFRTNQLTFAGALDELRKWSQSHPRHLPIVLTMNLKDGKSPVPGSKPAVAWDSGAYDALDKLIVDRLGRERVLVPDDVRGAADTLERAVTTVGWPPLGQCRGKFLWVMDEGGAKRNAYMQDHASLAGRVMFTTSPPGTPEAAILVLNDPIGQQTLIRQRVSQGYLVRTRADAETMEARSGDLTRFEAARTSGAHVISTDYYLPDWRINPSYQVRFANGSFACENPLLPGDAEVDR